MKVLVSTSSFAKHDSGPLDLLRDNGYEMVFNPYGRTLSPTEVLELAAGCSGIIAGTEPLGRETLEKLNDLKIISRVGSGIDNVDLGAAAELGVTVKATPDGPSQAVAELTLALTLALLRGVAAADSLMRQGVWQKNMGRLLQGKRVGIIGLGKIGKRVALLFKAFGCSIMASDVNPDTGWAAANGVDLVTLKELLADADIVTIHVAGGDQAVIGMQELAEIKPGAFLVNTARGRLIDEAALIEALKSGRLGGAALDVFQVEPYAGELKDLPNVVVTPHIGSYAIESRVEMEAEAVRNLMSVLEGFRS